VIPCEWLETLELETFEMAKTSHFFSFNFCYCKHREC